MKNICCILGVIYFSLASCAEEGGENELSNKSEYSILQKYEFDLRETDNSVGHKIVNDALGSGRQLIALPLKNRSSGYVVLLSDSRIDGVRMTIPQDEFIVTRDTLIDIRHKTRLSRNVDDFLSSRVPD
jgi:hypothetical protein